MENKPFTYTDDIKGYQNAVWDFLLEHSEASHSGKLFIKFGTDGKKNFENRVLARWKFNYHREDVEAKARKIKEQEQQYRLEKKKKKEKWRAERKARLALLKQPKDDGKTKSDNNLYRILSSLRRIFK